MIEQLQRPLSARACVSPSLRNDSGGAPAYEVKFLVPEAVARAVQDRVAATLRPDPHADPRFGGAYRTATLYFDTPDWAMYRQAKGYRGCKYRVRRYGEGPTAFLERKQKSKSQVRKRRTSAPCADLGLLATDFQAGWPGAWFAAETHAQHLRPTCRVDYLRTAFYDETAEGPVRLTFDRDLRAAAADRPRFEERFAGQPLGLGGVIMEFKFQASMPRFLAGLAAEFGLEPSQASKYRRAIDALGVRTAEVALCA